METLRKGVFEYACSKVIAQILFHGNNADFMNQITKDMVQGMGD